MRLFVPYDTSKDGTIFAKDAEKEVSLTEAPEFMVQLLSPIKWLNSNRRRYVLGQRSLYSIILIYTIDSQLWYISYEGCSIITNRTICGNANKNFCLFASAFQKQFCQYQHVSIGTRSLNISTEERVSVGKYCWKSISVGLSISKKNLSRYLRNRNISWSSRVSKEYVTGYEYHLHYGHPEEKRNTNVES